MTRQSFTTENIKRSARNLNAAYGSHVVSNAAHELSKEIRENNFEWGSVSKLYINKKTAYYLPALKDKLILNRLADNLKFSYRIEAPNRILIISQLMTLLKENVPFTVLKFDVKSFFESIDRSILFSELDYDLTLTTESRKLLYKLFDNPLMPSSGIPRGLPISTHLAELSIRAFDYAVKELPTVYFYTRFVDDILVFVSSKPTETEREIIKLSEAKRVPLHDKKRDSKTVECTRKVDGVTPVNSECFPECRCKIADGKELTLTFLGYCFHFNSAPLYNVKPSKIPLEVSLAESKKIKLTKRLFASFANYIKNNDYALLKDRIRFLTGTYTVSRAADGSRLKAGNYFSYPELTNLDALCVLDRMKAAILYGTQTRLSKKVNTMLSGARKRELARISFARGFSARYHYNFSSKRIVEIRGCFES